MNELHLFAGAGGGILAGQMLGHRTVCAVEWDAYAQSVLVARQNDECFPPFPIWDDVQTFDGRPWRGIVDIVVGGFPCQDISVAGKGAGIDGERSGMWSHMARVVGEVRPQLVFVENSPMLVNRGLGRVLGDLSALGYDSRWLVMGAADVGAPHQRDRLWLLASDTRQHRRGKRARKQVDWQLKGTPDAGTDGEEESLADAHGAQRQGDQRQGDQRQERNESQYANAGSSGWWAAEPRLDRMAHGVAHRAHRLKAIGNGQVPQCAAAAFQILYAQIQ